MPKQRTGHIDERGLGYCVQGGRHRVLKDRGRCYRCADFAPFDDEIRLTGGQWVYDPTTMVHRWVTNEQVEA